MRKIFKFSFFVIFSMILISGCAPHVQKKEIFESVKNYKKQEFKPKPGEKVFLVGEGFTVLSFPKTKNPNANKFSYHFYHKGEIKSILLSNKKVFKAHRIGNFSVAISLSKSAFSQPSPYGSIAVHIDGHGVLLFLLKAEKNQGNKIYFLKIPSSKIKKPLS